MADPLSHLRKFNVNKLQIIERNNQIIFGEYAWPKTVKTNYLICGTGKDGSPKDYYTLECLLFFLKNYHFIHPEYVKLAEENNISCVRRPDRKKLLAYLNGEISTSPSIDINAPLHISPVVKCEFEDQNEQRVVKKPRLKLQETKDQVGAGRESTSAELLD